MKKQLELLRSEESELKHKLAENKTKQNVLIIEIYKKESGLNVGDKVEINKGRTGVIDRFNVNNGTAEPVVRLFKKDGTPGNREARVWQFDKLTKLI